MKTLKRYLRIYIYLVRYMLQRNLEYRVSFVSNALASLGWVNFSLITILVLGQKTGGFGGWPPLHMLLLTGMWMINNGLAYGLFYINMKTLVDDIQKGNLDFALSKPLDSQFWVSLRQVLTNSFLGVIEGIIVVSWVITKLNLIISIWTISQFVILICAGLLVYYSLWFFTAALSIHFTATENLFYIVPELVDFSRFPVEAYPNPIGQLLASVLPVLVMTVFPARVLLGTLTPSGFLYAIFVGLVCLSLSRKFWHWSLRKYTSASS